MSPIFTSCLVRLILIINCKDFDVRFGCFTAITVIQVGGFFSYSHIGMKQVSSDIPAL